MVTGGNSAPAADFGLDLNRGKVFSFFLAPEDEWRNKEPTVDRLLLTDLTWKTSNEGREMMHWMFVISMKSRAAVELV
jgi:hypothetical protein